MSEDPSAKVVMQAGVIGAAGSFLAGLGELALHYSPNGFGGEAYSFFSSAPIWRISIGHFLCVFSVPLYFVGYWHLFEMLKPAGRNARLLILSLGLYAFALGNVWLGSRVDLALIVQARDRSAAADTALFTKLLEDAAFYNETILIAVRAAVLIISGLFVVLVLGGRTSYPKWMAALNPIGLVLATFLVYFAWPTLGGLIMPEAMNTAHFVFFVASVVICLRAQARERHVVGGQTPDAAGAGGKE
jgi:hypothetical protein